MVSEGNGIETNLEKNGGKEASLMRLVLQLWMRQRQS